MYIATWCAHAVVLTESKHLLGSVYDFMCTSLHVRTGCFYLGRCPITVCKHACSP